MYRWIALLLALMLPLAAVAEDSFSPAQRAEIVRILREAMKADPSILADAITALQADETRQKEAATQQVVSARHDELFANAADAVAGNPAGDVAMIEFYDPRCPYCRKMLPEIDALLHSDPHLKLIYKDIPVLGPASEQETRAILAAQAQGGYAKMQAAVMSNPAPPSAEMIRATATALGLDADRLARDMASPAMTARIAGNLALAHALHVDGTPTIVIGSQVIPGAVEIADLQSVIAAARRRAVE